MSVSRREFLFGMPVAGAALAMVGPSLSIRRSPQSPGGLDSADCDTLVAPTEPVEPIAPVVSFHLDQPYLDLTGLEKPYIPPAGMRSGAPLAGLSDEVFSRFYGFI